VASTQLLLLVENHTLIQNALHDALTDTGYDVAVASDGRNALRQLKTGAARFGGLITDIALGAGPDGWEVGRRARELSPHIQVVYMSGQSGRDWPAKGVPNSVMASKPFAVAQIVAAISALLSGRHPQMRQVKPMGANVGAATSSISNS
jgi:DNA-binding response OmpR family regulator